MPQSKKTACHDKTIYPDGTFCPKTSGSVRNFSSACRRALDERCSDALNMGMMITGMMMTMRRTTMMMMITMVMTCPTGRLAKPYRPSLAATLASRSSR